MSEWRERIRAPLLPNLKSQQSLASKQNRPPHSTHHHIIGNHLFLMHHDGRFRRRRPVPMKSRGEFLLKFNTSTDPRGSHWSTRLSLIPVYGSTMLGESSFDLRIRMHRGEPFFIDVVDTASTIFPQVKLVILMISSISIRLLSILVKFDVVFIYWLSVL